MRRLLFRLALLVVPWVVLWAGAEWLVWNREKNQFTEKLQKLEKQRATTEILALGSSHTYRAFLPTRLGRPAFSAALPSQSLYYDAEFGVRCIETLPALKLVIQGVSYYSLESRLDEGRESWRIYQYSHFYDIAPRDWRMRAHVRNFSLLFARGRDQGIKSLVTPTLYHPSQDEFGAPLQWPKREAALEESAAARIGFHHKVMHPDHLPENLAHIQRLAAAAKRRNVALVIVTPPHSRAYRARMRPEAKQRMLTSLTELAAQEGLLYCNFLESNDFVDDDYFDADHLNAGGAEKFTELLRAQVAPLLAR